MIKKGRFSVIVNPSSGNGLGIQNWSKIQALLCSKSIDYSEYFTLDFQSTKEHIHSEINNGIRSFIAVGGDGTMNEVANSILSHSDFNSDEFNLSVIPVGTGNDWCRTYKIPFDYEKAIEIISDKNYLLQDVGKASFFFENGEQNRYFINVAGVGFDAYVAERTNQKSGAGSGTSFGYLWNLLSGLFKYKSSDIIINYDSKELMNLIFSMSIGIGKYNGGGMMQLPDALPDDGVFDITVINKMNKLDIIRNIKKLYDGSLYEHPKVNNLKAKKIRIDSKPPIKLEIDGEICGLSPFEIEILPAKLKVCVPKS